MQRAERAETELAETKRRLERLSTQSQRDTKGVRDLMSGVVLRKEWNGQIVDGVTIIAAHWRKLEKRLSDALQGEREKALRQHEDQCREREYLQRAERAEAACARLRRALEYFITWGKELNKLIGYRATLDSWREYEEALESDAGKPLLEELARLREIRTWLRTLPIPAGTDKAIMELVNQVLARRWLLEDVRVAAERWSCDTTNSELRDRLRAALAALREKEPATETKPCMDCGKPVPKGEGTVCAECGKRLREKSRG